MTKSLRAIFLLAGVILAAPAVVTAQTTPEASPPPAYRPGLGDLMTGTIQPRHIKLALAGREKNWVYAAYELREMEEAFDRLSVVWPQWRQVRIVEMIETIIRQPLFDLGQAIKQKNEVRYAEALWIADRGLQCLSSRRAPGSRCHSGTQGIDVS
jgi:hypothetical protein